MSSEDNDNNFKKEDDLGSVREKVSFQRFKELEGKSSDRAVKGEDLKSGLISSNKFFVGDAVQIIEDLLRTGLRTKVDYDTYIRSSSSSTEQK
jgi:hypothetical protein